MINLTNKVLYYQNICIPRMSPKKIYFEFGVFENNTLINYIKTVQEFCTKYNENIDEFIIYAFDSFQGLPEPTALDNHIDWVKGEFPCSKTLLLDNIKATGFPEKNVHIIEGYFENTLTPQLFEELKNKKIFPSFVNIDVDYYTSTKTVMDWLIPLCQSGCIFYFDDIWSFHGHPDLGELRYINEFNKSGKGYLTPFNYMSMPSDQTYMFCRKDWEWIK